MYIALNSKKQRIHISESIDGDKYYCPVCNEEVIKRKGTINAHHYAHKNNSQCLEKDGWHYDMSDLHYDWQNQFPVDSQEVVFKFNKSRSSFLSINISLLEELVFGVPISLFLLLSQFLPVLSLLPT